jgi:hypothetical protein
MKTAAAGHAKPLQQIEEGHDESHKNPHSSKKGDNDLA